MIRHAEMMRAVGWRFPSLLALIFLRQFRNGALIVDKVPHGQDGVCFRHSRTCPTHVTSSPRVYPADSSAPGTAYRRSFPHKYAFIQDVFARGRTARRNAPAPLTPVGAGFHTARSFFDRQFSRAIRLPGIVLSPNIKMYLFYTLSSLSTITISSPFTK